MTTKPSEVDFHFDPMCPFAYHTSRWIREVRAHTGLTVNWRFFSLEEVNRFEGKKHPWERSWSYGWSQMRVAALLRRRDPALLDAWYARVGRELHLDGGRPHDPATARRLLAEIGADPATLDEALADPSTHDDVRIDHQRVIDAGGFGVPTLFFPDGQCLFGPVLVDPPVGEAAVRLWDVVTGMLAFPHVYELQRPKAERDERAIADALAPYLRGRDWVSVNRGQVIDFRTGQETTS
ncbi:putative DsbA family dithiol-disulfide isomerase [Prauserella shujinwangii]|uniref:Putative DsbA family dithiol-disulfide isomerase n=1 Tax=Prauserella shujinwangii TaxID=1453103 RepID=A0A2T0LTD1_9PSEU|nr:DsbA family protein [Prauserella shujinwangii]PRX46991.1 putative DsbA family dithiol-disulfide isomerase [Prauserella shujinwangii]